MEHMKAKAEMMRKLEVDRRFSIARTWALAARDVADESGDGEAMAAADFINNRTALGIPSESKRIWRYFQGQPALSVYDYAFLTPVIDSDLSRLDEHDERRRYVTDNSPYVAQYREGSQAIYFSEDPLSTKGKGIILLHEALHARNDIEHRYNHDDPLEHWREEADVYGCEFRILASLADERYEVIIRNGMKSIAADDDARYVSLPKIDVSTARPLWRDIFGNEISLKEEQLWTYVSMLDAFWRYLDKNFQDAREEFAKYLQHTQGPVE